MLKITRFFGELLLFNRYVVSNSFVTPWMASLSLEFPRQEYWSGLPFPSPGDLPDPGIFLIQGSDPRLPHLLPCRQILNC